MVGSSEETTRENETSEDTQRVQLGQGRKTSGPAQERRRQKRFQPERNKEEDAPERKLICEGEILSIGVMAEKTTP